jgi:hypothetical protein
MHSRIDCFISICRTCSVHLAFDIAPKEVVWYCKIRQVGWPGGVPETRNESAWKCHPEDLDGNLCCMGSCSILLEPQQTEDKCFQHDTVLLCIQLLYAPLHSQRNRYQCHEKKLHATQSLLHYTEDIGEVRVGCLEPTSNISLYSHNQEVSLI